MSRRDTIIIAALVNAGLLMILFTTAIRSKTPNEGKKMDHVGANLAETLPARSSSQDDLLNEYVIALPTLAEAARDPFYTFENGELALAPIPSAVSTTPQEVTKPLAPLPQRTEPSKVKTEEHFVNVTVKKGDVLEKIAKANNTTVSAIMKTNHLSSTQLKIGQLLKIPLSDSPNTPSLPISSGSQFEGQYYIVKEGDNPWLIASRNKINLDELLRLNDLDEQKAKRLRPGDKLKIR